MRIFLACLFLLLVGCDEVRIVQDPPEITACYETLQSKDEIRPIMFNKCTGESWMLVRTRLHEKTKSSPSVFTYRWYSLDRYNGEPELFHATFE